MKLLKCFLACAITLSSLNVSAVSMAEKYGVSDPLGTDIQKKIFSKLFDIELWSADFPHKYDQDITIRIKFASRFESGDVIEFLAEEAQEIHGFSSAQLSELQSSMEKSITCDPRANSIVDFNYLPKKGIQVTCDGEVSPSLIKDGPHSFFLLDVFLHPESEYENLANN